MIYPPIPFSFIFFHSKKKNHWIFEHIQLNGGKQSTLGWKTGALLTHTLFLPFKKDDTANPFSMTVKISS